MKGVRNLTVLIFSALFIFSCSQPNEIDKPVEKAKAKYSIPDSVIYKSNLVIISKVGRAFFNSYIKLDSSSSKFSLPDSFCIKNPSRCADYLARPYYYMVYKFTPAGCEDYKNFIEIVVDTNGVVVPSRPVFGIPGCPSNNCWGSFQIIEKEKAVEIARQNGLEEGIKEWTVSFHFYAGTFNNYVWEIKNTLMEDKSVPSQYLAKGKTFLVNAMDGSIFKISNWTIVT